MCLPVVNLAQLSSPARAPQSDKTHASSLFFTRVTPTNTSGVYTINSPKRLSSPSFGKVPLLYAWMGMLYIIHCYTLFQLPV